MKTTSSSIKHTTHGTRPIQAFFSPPVSSHPLKKTKITPSPHQEEKAAFYLPPTPSQQSIKISLVPKPTKTFVRPSPVHVEGVQTNGELLQWEAFEGTRMWRQSHSMGIKKRR
jgi:hypothetical protein